MDSTSAASSFSTTKQKDVFIRNWYPNGVPMGGLVAESMSLARMLPRNVENLNTDSDISELAEFEHADLVPVAEEDKSGATISFNSRSVTFDRSRSVSTREKMAVVSNWEVITGTRLSMASRTTSNGKPRHQNVGALWQQLMKERKDRQDCLFLLEQLQENYDLLLQKYAKAENTIDFMRIRRGIEDGPAEPPRADCSQAERIGHREGGSVKSELRRSTKEHERESLAPPPASVANRSNTNPTQKPSLASIQMRANCLKDQINFTKLAMQERDDSLPREGEIVRELEGSLELLKQDYRAVSSSRKDRGLETNILQLQQSLQELETSFGMHACPQERLLRESRLASDSSEPKKTNCKRGARRIVWPPPPTLDYRETDDSVHQQPVTSRSIMRIPSHASVAPINGQLGNWSVAYFGKLEANVCIDKKVVKNVFQSEQDPNFSLGHSSAMESVRLESATSNDNEGVKNPGYSEGNERAAATGKPKTKRSDGPKKNARSTSDLVARSTQAIAIRFESRGGDPTECADVHTRKPEINLQSKEDNIAKLKILSKLQSAERKAQDLHEKSSEILSHIYSTSNSKRFSSVYY